MMVLVLIAVLFALLFTVGHISGRAFSCPRCHRGDTYPVADGMRCCEACGHAWSA